MKKYFLIVFTLLIATALWGKHKKHKKAKPMANTIQSVMLHHTACFGRCPDYSILVSKDGQVTYTGIRFVTDSGIYTKKADVTKAMAILNLLATNHVDTCTKMYPNPIPDLPGLYVNVTYKDSVKKIFNAEHGPEFLLIACHMIDSLGKKTGDGWQKK